MRTKKKVKKLLLVSLCVAVCLSIIFGAIYTIGYLTEPVVEFTPLEERVYTDGELNAEPDPSKYVKITAIDNGNDIYTPCKDESYVYRYGPSMIRNADGSIDAYFSAPGVFDQWDWIFYRHSPDGGKTWTTEKSVLQPTPDSADFYSCCDPGIVKIGDYYYLAYTSTVVEGGVDNNVFVARSENLDGPFEKWNGSGWGGRPAPIIEYTGDPDTYGAGEPSMVVLDGKLYLYYTWRDGELNQTRLSIADANNPDWPSTLEYNGIAIDHIAGDTDSADVKYVEDYGKFIAVSTASRFTTDSYLKVYCSDDGLTFEESYALKSNTSHCCHNCGITGRPDGHIRLSDNVYIAYAYGQEFGTWATRINEVKLSLIDAPDLSDIDNENFKNDFEPASPTYRTNYVGITTDPHIYDVSLSDGSFKVEVYKIDTHKDDNRIKRNVTLKNYDESIISVDGLTVTPLKKGETFITAVWEGHETTFLITVK